MPNKPHQPPGDSSPVVSSQTGIHEQLNDIVQRHRQHPFRKPLADFNRVAFEQAQAFVARQQKPLILDSGCGVGESTRKLAQAFPDHCVLGVDRSDDRLQRKIGEVPHNALLLRADLSDFWRLAVEAGWQLARHFLLYPNPSPKKKDIKLRWHGHPAFPFLVALGGQLECRTNWLIYAQELQQALSCYDIHASLQPLVPDDPLTPFERKYHASGHALWQLKADLRILNS